MNAGPRVGSVTLTVVVAFLALTPWSPAPANHIVMHGGPFGGVVVNLVVHPREPETLYVAAFGSGVYKSVDGGRRWIATSRGLDDLAVLTLAIDPIAPHLIYAGTDSGVFVSMDGGETWGRRGVAMADRNIRSFVVDPRRPTVLYAATDRGILWSWDQGASWAPRGSGTASLDVRVLRLDPAHPARLFAAGFGGVFRSADSGRHWTSASRGLTDLRVRALALDPTRPDVLYAGTSGGGVFETLDGGGRWRPLNEGLRNLTVLSLLATPGGDLLAGTVGGVYRRPRRDAAGWELVGDDVLTLTVTFVVHHSLRPGTLYAGTGGLVFVSNDHGRRWRELAVSVAEATDTRPAAPAAADDVGTHSIGERR
ncbi:MAG: hypothetical protein HY614_10140 [Candidatus Rokubacteria bacterium]|nr:hypothetical protein [Candidatus Rokubacteria bacterium]